MKSEQLIPTKKILEGAIKLIMVAFIAGSASQCMADSIASESDERGYYEIYSGVNFDERKIEYAEKEALQKAASECKRIGARAVILGLDMRRNEDKSRIVSKVHYNCIWSSI